MTRRVAIIGATGSVGRQALDVASMSGQIDVVAVAAHSRWHELAQFVAADTPICLVDTDARHEAQSVRPDLQWLPDVDALLDAAEIDVVLNAAVGSAGLSTTVAALTRGIDVALANKESLVCAGRLVTDLARANDAALIPVDSEHSALMQCMQASHSADIESLVLTASGGPFVGQDVDELQHVSIEQALAHPTWSMGSKISVDSATLMNKGLELIEASVLFDLDQERIEVVVHRDSIVHALVRNIDGSLVAHLGWPDMRVPIAHALLHPRRADVGARRLDLVDIPALRFEQPDERTFRCLALARAAAASGAGSCCVLNAANEVAVSAFLAGQLGFLQIADVVERCLEAVDAPIPRGFDEVQELDRQARAAVDRMLAAAV